MHEKHLIKIVTLLWRVSREIMEQSMNKLPGRKGDIFLVISRKIDTGLAALVVALFSDGFKCSDTNRMPCKIS